MGQPSPTKHTSCAHETENVLQWELELNSALAAAKMWLLKGCMLKVLGLSWCVTIPHKQISLPGQGITK